MPTYSISDGNAVFTGLSAERAREMASEWYSEGDWGDDTDLDRLQLAGVPLWVDYTEDEDPADIASRVSDLVADALAQQAIDEGSGDHFCNLRSNFYAACKLWVRESP